MNQIDEQKSLVEYLEAALTAARKHLASDPEKITKLNANWPRRGRSLSVLSRTSAQPTAAATKVLSRPISRPAPVARF